MTASRPDVDANVWDERRIVRTILPYLARTHILPAWARAHYVKIAQRVWRLVSKRAVLSHALGIGVMSVRPWDLVGSRVFFYGVWEPVITRFVRNRLRPDAVAIDIGANIGYYTLLFSRLVGPSGVVYSVEPSPSIREDLKMNIVLNAAMNIQVVPCGIASESGTKEFYLSKRGNIGASHFSTPASGDRLEGRFELKRLRDVIPAEALSRAALIKIDVEGMEEEVLRDVVDTLGLFPHRITILAEIRLASRDSRVCTLVDALRAARFDTYMLENRYDNDYYAAGNFALPRRITDLPFGQLDVAFVRD